MDEYQDSMQFHVTWKKNPILCPDKLCITKTFKETQYSSARVNGAGERLTGLEALCHYSMSANSRVSLKIFLCLHADDLCLKYA